MCRKLRADGRQLRGFEEAPGDARGSGHEGGGEPPACVPTDQGRVHRTHGAARAGESWGCLRVQARVGLRVQVRVGL